MLCNILICFHSSSHLKLDEGEVLRNILFYFQSSPHLKLDERDVLCNILFYFQSSPRLKLDEGDMLSKNIWDKIQYEEPSDTTFDEVQARVRNHNNMVGLWHFSGIFCSKMGYNFLSFNK